MFHATAATWITCLLVVHHYRKKGFAVRTFAAGANLNMPLTDGSGLRKGGPAFFLRAAASRATRLLYPWSLPSTWGYMSGAAAIPLSTTHFEAGRQAETGRLGSSHQAPPGMLSMTVAQLR